MTQLSWSPGCSKECYGFRGPPFPQKLFSAMDTPRPVIQWTNNGQAISVDAEHYERNVMRVHPGLVEISSFANFRRQMREYGFDWLYHTETREFEFSHPSFLRGRPELLPAVLTRRKRRRRHAVASCVGTRQRGASVPRRCSVISYAVAASTDSGRARVTCVGPQTRDVGAAKALNEMTDEEWWTYCAPAIIAGMEDGGTDDVASGRQSVETRFTVPLIFYRDDTEEDTGRAVSGVRGGLWTHRKLDFDEL